MLCWSTSTCPTPPLLTCSQGMEHRGTVAAVPVRVVIGEDDVLLREGLARILSEAGFDVVAEAGDAVDFLRKARAHKPDVAGVDVQMPPGNEGDGRRAALELRAGAPGT